MDLKKLFTEDRAVSPVIGVILMVAITVILAAVIGAFVLGIGGETDAAPQASLSLIDETPDNDQFSIEHRGGDRIDFNDITIIVSAGDESDRLSLVEDINDDDEYEADPDEISTGDTTTVTIDSEVLDGPQNARVRLLHIPSDSIILDRSVDINSD